MGKPRKMLSDWDVPYLQPLIRLVETQSKVTLAHWAVDYSEKVMLPIWSEAFPGDSRPQLALEAARQWLDGKIKLPQAKTAILACHAAAREAESFPAAQAAARATTVRWTGWVNDAGSWPNRSVTTRPAPTRRAQSTGWSRPPCALVRRGTTSSPSLS